MTRWDEQFHRLVTEIATWSRCNARKIGAILVRDKTVIATGFNGPPRGVPHCEYRFQVGVDPIFQATFEDLVNFPGERNLETNCPRRALGAKKGQHDLRHLCPAAHAEENCIVNAARTGVSTMGSIMYMSCEVPCAGCLRKIINAGIIEIVCTSLNYYEPMSTFLLSHSDVRVRTYSHIKPE